MVKRAVYVTTGDGWMRRMVPIANVPLMFAVGAKPTCGHCGSPICRADPAAGPYDCPQMPARQFMRCPVGQCRKKVYDPLNPDIPVFEDGSTDPNEIAVAEYSQRTAAERIKARLDRHMLAYHTEEAAIYGVKAAPVDPQLQPPNREAVPA